MVLLFFVLALSCRRGSGPGGPIKAIDVEAPDGIEGAAVSRCDHDGKKCTAVSQGETLADGTLIKSAAGARASFELGPATALDVNEQSEVLLASSSSLEVMRGSLVVRRLGSSAEKADPLQIAVAGRTAEIDPKVGGTVSIRAKTPERAALTVDKGKLTLRSGFGQTMSLLSGETVDLTKGRPPERSASFVAVEPRNSVPLSPLTVAQGEPRGLGRMTARVPGRTEVVSGVRLVAHNVDVVVRDGLARTEIEEVFQNDTPQVLEGRYVFPLPADASISRLALWVNDKPVEGEIVEKKRAAAIFKEIVEDTVRPRDPALLEWVSGGEFSLKIFPLPPRGSRKVRIAYDEVLKESGGRVRYVYPVSVGAERSTQIDDFSVQVRATDTRAKLEEVETPGYAAAKGGDDRGIRVGFSAKQFTPSHDFIVSYTRQTDGDAEVSAYVPAWGEFKGGGLDDAARGAEGAGYFVLRVRADLAPGVTPPHVRRDRAIVIDSSHSQSKETLEGAAKLAVGLARQMDPDEKFVILACDSACDSYPESGLALPTEEHITEAQKWLSARAPTGSSDVAGALIDGARRVAGEGSGQVVYIGDGSPTSGELSASNIAARLRSTIGARRVDLRFLGAGRAVDELVLSALAETLGATYEPVLTGESIEHRVSELAMSLRSPVIRSAAVELPNSFGDVYPRTLRNLRLGEQVVLVGRLSGNEPGEVKLRGDLDGQPYALSRQVRWTPEAARQNPLAPRLWALSRISDLESATDPETIKHVIELSKRYHVMSRYTSLLVLENDQMFAEFGIKRTAPPPAGLSLDEFAAGTGRSSDAPRDDKGDMASDDRLGAAPLGATRSEPKPRTAPPAATVPPPAPVPAPVRAAVPAPAKKAAMEAEADSPRSASAPAPAAAPRTTSLAEDAVPANPSGAAAGLQIASGGPALGGPPAFRGTGSVQVGAPQVNGGLGSDVVLRALRAQQGRMHACYEAGLARNPQLAGRLNVRFVIGQNGEVLSSINGGSSLGDASVIACVLAVVRAVRFPPPGSGFATVLVPLTFRLGEAPAWSPPAEPSAVHRAADDSWLTKGDETLAKLRAELDRNQSSRKKYEDLVRGLLARGRFEEALAVARQFVSADPDLPVARELLAYAGIANDDPQLAVSSIDAQAETDPSSLKWHVRGARAFEAFGDERRACAHWRSLAELAPKSDEYTFEALRCRTRVLDDRDGALADARSLANPGKLVAALIPELDAGRPPPFAKSTAGSGQFEAEVSCAGGERCPTVFVVSPLGNVFSPFTPTDSRSSAKSVAFSGLRDGTYMTLLTGGSSDARGEVEIRALGSIRRFSIARGGRQTVAATRVTFPRLPLRPWSRVSDGFLAR